MPYANPETRRQRRRENYPYNRQRILEKEKVYRRESSDRFLRTKLKYRYGISEQCKDTMIQNQEGLCALCCKAEPVDIDHCHITSKLRGVLCRSCNIGLGMFRDDEGLLLKAIEYLRGSNDENVVIIPDGG